jgi:hypothetical protein
LNSGNRRFDLPGAVSVTGGLALLVYAISKALSVGWETGRTIGLLAGSAAILAFFVAWELRRPTPLMPFSVFRNRSLSAANAVRFLLGGVTYATFFILTLYVQGDCGLVRIADGIDLPCCRRSDGDLGRDRAGIGDEGWPAVGDDARVLGPHRERARLYAPTGAWPLLARPAPGDTLELDDLPWRRATPSSVWLGSNLAHSADKR